MKHYAYFFTRQDMSPEQQIVQTAHAAYVLGVMSQRVDMEKLNSKTTDYVEAQFNEQVDPHTTNFTVIGVRDRTALEAVEDILAEFGFRYEKFFEPDHKDGEYTAIGVYAVPENRRHVLMAFNLLQLPKK